LVLRIRGLVIGFVFAGVGGARGVILRVRVDSLRHPYEHSQVSDEDNFNKNMTLQLD